VPELPEVEAVRRQLEPVLTRARIADVDLRRKNLRVPFGPEFRARLVGQTIESVGRRAKYLVIVLSSSDTLIIHLGMSGSFNVDRSSATAARDRHDHVVFHLASGERVTFNDPRRFGSMKVLTAIQLKRHPVLGRVGPEPLSADFDAAALARACRGKKVALKIALMDQRVIAGIGNIYASEALHAARLSPFRRASSIVTSSGAPGHEAYELTKAIKQVLTAAIDRTSGKSYRSGRFRVYGRGGERCLRPRCIGVIKRRTQGGRSTYYCPVCQR